MESIIFIYVYFAGIAVNALAVLVVALKVGEWKRGNRAKIVSFSVLSWVGVGILISTAAAWTAQQKERARRFPRPEVKDIIF